MVISGFLYYAASFFNRTSSGLHVIVTSGLPAGAGLGSSAAYSVCIAAGFLHATGAIGRAEEPTTAVQAELHAATNSSLQVQGDSAASFPERISKKLEECGYSDIRCGTHVWSQQELGVVNKWGFEAEKLIHGTPSGIDNSISAYGQWLYRIRSLQAIQI